MTKTSEDLDRDGISQQTAAPPFSAYLTEFLLRGPTLTNFFLLPSDVSTRAEVDRICGKNGAGIGAVWREHQTWLRAQAAALGIAPRFPHDTFYFAEAIARDEHERKGTRNDR